MAEKPRTNEPAGGPDPDATPVRRDKASTTWVIPVITAVVLGMAFAAYYFIYVGARRQYLANRNFRALALLGDQLQQRIAIHSNILSFCAELAANSKSTHREKENLERFLLVHEEDRFLKGSPRMREALKDYLKYLSPSFELSQVNGPKHANTSGLQVARRNDRWMLILRSVLLSSVNYEGSLRLDELMQPLVGSAPFDDILLVSNHGSIVYQYKKAGPQFTTLSALLQSQTAVPEKAAKGQSENTDGKAKTDAGEQTEGAKTDAPIHSNSDPAWRSRSLHLTDVTLAGVPYKLFLQPVLVSAAGETETQTEAANEWVLCGLRSSAALDWEALSLSFPFFIWCTFAFFILWANYKVLKIFFMNRRERLRLREFGTLGLSLLLLTTVVTLSLLQLNFRYTDDTDARLRTVGQKLSSGIHDELHRMQEQLVEWCGSKELKTDLQFVASQNKEVIRNTPPERRPATPLSGPPIPRTPPAQIYPFTSNAFWTDDDGHQIVKWSNIQYVTPMIDVSQLSTFFRPSAHFDGDGRLFQFASLMPPNKVEYLATFGMKLRACAGQNLDPDLDDDIAGGSAFLTAQPLTVVDPILPYGFGFMLVDDSGKVLFHSDKTKNGGENLRMETDDNRELYAAIYNHASQRSLPLTYGGADYRALVVPAPGISQASWSLVVYRDLTSVRTLNLQAMAVSSTLLFCILAPLVVLVALWLATVRHRYAPEWLWPNARRVETYLYQLFLYALLCGALLLVCFEGTAEAAVVSCVASVYSAALLTWWCYRVYPSAGEKPLARKATRLAAVPATLAGIGALGFAALIVYDRPRSNLASLILAGGIVAAVPLLDRPRRILIAAFHRSNLTRRAERRLLNYRRCYLACALLLLTLCAVLVPMTLFRAGLNVERRLAVKQSQRHLAARLSDRWGAMVGAWENNELGRAAWDEFAGQTARDASAHPWRWIVPVDLTTPDGDLPLDIHKPGHGEFYSGWWQWVLYRLHHDYNESSAEMLGVIPDTGNTSDWTWDHGLNDVTLRWHGAHPARQVSDPMASHGDLLIASELPRLSGRDVATGVAIVFAVALIVGGLLRALARKLFLFRIAPLKMHGTRLLAEFIREGKNVVVLLPPVSDWRLEAPKWTFDIAAQARTPGWADAVDLAAIPSHVPIEIDHFEFGAADPEMETQKSRLLERLQGRRAGRMSVVLVMTVPVSANDYRRAFPDWEVVDLREEPFLWLKEYEGPAQHLIWNECSPIPALWPIGAQLAKDIRAEGVYSRETIASEILERADGYYRLVWSECTKEQKFVLTQLAEDGVLNPMNDRAIRQLVRRGLITSDPQFRVVNESFRRFVRSAPAPELKVEWLRESRRSGWGKAQGAFLTSMTLVGLFLLTTQNALWQSAAAYVTTALGALGTMAKLFDAVRARGGGSAEKPS